VSREYTRTDVMMEWLDLIEQIAGHPLNVQRSDLDSRNEIEQIGLLRNLLVREGIISSALEPDMLRGPLRVFAASLRTQYQPAKPYPGPVQLVVADNAKLDGNANRLEHELNAKGWKHWAPNLVCLHASGNHMTMLKEPHVRSLVQLSGLVAKAFSIAGS
jgi:thioesterase domain-containing protein